ncbi:MAG: hypothetical protein WC886_08645, partial [Saccharofermentanaceae bacterium]
AWKAMDDERLDNQLVSMSKIQQERDSELAKINQSYIDGTMSYEKAEAEKLRIARKYELLIAQESLKALEENITMLSPGEQAKAASDIAAMKLKITENLAKDQYDSQSYYNDLKMDEYEMSEKAWEELKKDEVKAQKEADEKKKEIIQATADLIKEVGSAIFDISNSRIEEEITGIETKRDKELSAADESITDEKKKKEAQAAINAKYDKLLAEEKTKQAKNDKAAAIFNIAIQTAENIVKAGLNPVLVAFAAAMGAVQLAAVIAKPIPKYAKGTFGQYNTPETFVAGEAGTEWIQKKTGEMMAITSPTVVTNAKGSRVFSNPEIKALERMMISNTINYDTAELRALRESQDRGFNKLSKSLRSQKQYLVQNGKTVGFKQNDYTKKYLERMVP